MTGRVMPVMVSELQGDRKPESAGEEVPRGRGMRGSGRGLLAS
jgi:hypothetical protein